MCDFSLMLLAAGTAVSAGVSIYQGQMQADAARAAASINAESQRMQADLERQKGDAAAIAAQNAARREQEKVKRLQAQQQNMFAAEGILIDEGSPLEILIDTAREGAMDVAAVENRGRIEALNARKQAAVREYQADLEIQKGEIQADAAERSGWIGALGAGVRFMTGDPVLRRVM